MAGQGQSAAAVIAAASDEATQVFNNILLNLENLIATNRRRRMRSASTQPTAVTRSLSARSLTARTDLLEMPFHDSRTTSVNTARSYYISTAEDKTSRYPTAESTSYLTNDSLHSGRPQIRTARDNSVFSDTSAGSTGSTAVSPMVDADFATARNRTNRGRSPTLRVTTNSQTMTPRQAWSHVPIGSYSVIRPMGYKNSETAPRAYNDQEERPSASTGLSPFSTGTFGLSTMYTTTAYGINQAERDVSKAVFEETCGGRTGSPHYAHLLLEENRQTAAIPLNTAIPQLPSRSISADATEALMTILHETGGGRTGSPHYAHMILNEPDTMTALISLHTGTVSSDGISEISTAVSQSMSPSITTDEPTTNTNTTTTSTTAPRGESREKLPSAEPISSPCGRTAFHPPLGPSAIPTDQIMIMKEGTDKNREKLLSAEPISSPCGRTAFHPPLGPSAIPTDQIMIMKEGTDKNREKLLSAEPISSPCGRTAFHPPLGPSAIPTDQIMIMKEGTDKNREKLLSAEPISSPCGRTAFHPFLGPSTIPTDQMLIMKEGTEDQDISTAQGERPISSRSMSMDSSTNTYEYRSRAEKSLSGDFVPTAVPIGSPCGRTRFYVPLGPSAIPTDQIVIFDAQTTTGDSLGSTTTEFSAAAEYNEYSPQQLRTASPIGTPCGRTKFQVPLGPSATPTDQILKFETEITRTVVPGMNVIDFTPLTAAGSRPLTGFDQDQWNLARNDNSDPNINMKTAREPSEVKLQSEREKKAFSRSPLSPIANTARLPSGDTLFKESVMQMGCANQQKENDQVQQVLSQFPVPQETTPEGLPQVEVIKLWPRDERMSPTPGVVTAREWMMSPTPGVFTAHEISMSPTTGVTTAAEIADSIAQVAQAPTMSPASELHTARSSYYDAATMPDILDSSTLGAAEINETSNNNLIPLQVTVAPEIQSSLGESMQMESEVRDRKDKSTRPSLFGRNSRLLRPITITPVLPQTNLKSPAPSQTAESQAQSSSVPSSVPSLPSISSTKAFQSAGRGQRLGHSTTGGSALSRLLRARSSSGFRSERNPPSTRLRRSIPEDANRALGRKSFTADANSTSAFSSSTASRFGFNITRQGSASGMSTSGSNFGRRIRPGDGYPSSTQEPSSRSAQPLSEGFGHRLPSSRFGLPPAPEGWKERILQRRNLLASNAGTGGSTQQDGQALNTAQESSLRSMPLKIRKTPSERPHDSSVKTARPIRSKTLRRRPKPLDNRPSYYGAQGKIKKINKRNLRKPVRMARETNFEEETTQKRSPDAESDKHVGNGSPQMKTAVGDFEEASLNESVKPAQIIIHEQNADGSFKLELHMACNMNSTGRLNLSGRAPAGLIPKRVSVNGKEIWIAS